MKAIFLKKHAPFSLLFILLLLIVFGCEPGEGLKPMQETGTMIDVDSNVYKTVKIGNQWWMAENLKVTKYRNGEAIPPGNYSNGLGLLYNWYAVNDTSKIAPAGWHVPSDEEWKELEKYLGMSEADADKVNFRGTHEGEKLKAQGSNNWVVYNNYEVFATNESGFSALAGNCRMFDGSAGQPFGSVYTGFWWTSTASIENNQAWYRHLDYKKANVFRFYGPKAYGFSVRCVKD